MRTWFMLAPVLAAAIVARATVSLAQPATCLERSEAARVLTRHYQEQQIGIGLANMGRSVVELYVGESGSWTILVTRADGMSCVVAAGEDWSTSAPNFALENSL